ncbi:hypothetical protein [Lacticaseibacillus saniviri]|uniref:hypothetical protein n=1 Tax=Lacticaseibacillus saniviri TaxID=931533 RepID=UPI0006D113FD|nr:hypothetical protein [Lacticaseibacillus saniviri]
MTNKPGRIIFYRYRFLLLALLVFGILFAWMNSSLLTTNVYYQQSMNQRLRKSLMIRISMIFG